MIRHLFNKKAGALCAVIIFIAAVLWSCNKPVVADIIAGADNPAISLKKKKTLLIVLDGVVGTSLEELDLPAIKKMLNNSIYSFYGLTDTISNDGTTWSDLITGTRLNKHNVTAENFSANNFAQYPSFLKRLKDNNSQFKSVAISTLPLLANGVFGSEVNRHIHLPNNDLAAKDSAVNRLKSDDADLLLVDFSSVHTAGKSYGYGAAVPQYRSALQTVDSYIDELVYTLQHRSTYANENWMVVITSTHGGTAAGTYGGKTSTERNVFSIYYNPQFTKSTIPRPLYNVPFEGSFIKFNTENGIIKHAYTSNSTYNFGESQNFTIEFKMKTALSQNDPAIMGNKNWGSGSNTGWVIFMENRNWKINFRASTSSRFDVIGSAVADNKWHTIAVSIDRKGKAVLYQDGLQVNSIDISARTGHFVTQYPFVIGSEGTKTYSPRLSDTYIADVRIWNTALPSDVLLNAQYTEVTSSHPFHKNLIGYWKMNEEGNVLKDYSNTAANLTYVGPGTRPFIADLLNPSSLDIRLLTPGLVDHSFRVMTWMGMKVDYQPWGLDGKVWSGN